MKNKKHLRCCAAWFISFNALIFIICIIATSGMNQKWLSLATQKVQKNIPLAAKEKLADNFNSSKNTESGLFNSPFRNANVQYASLVNQQTHEDKYLPKISLTNDKSNFTQQFTGYWGFAGQQSFDGVQIMKDSNFNHFTLAFANTLATESDSRNLGANYWDQIQEIHALGGEVTMGFGGQGGGKSFFNNAPSEEVMYWKLLNICQAYHIYSFDFDLEDNHELYINTPEFQALAMALGKLRTIVKTLFNEQLQVRFTKSNFDPRFVDYFCKFYDKSGENVIWNNMSLTSYHVPNGAENNSESNNINSSVNETLAALKQTETYKNYWDDEILHHVGVTAAIDRSNHITYQGYCDYFANFRKQASQVGLFGIWSISNDHPANSKLDPEHANGNQTYDYQYTRIIAHFVNRNIADWYNYGDQSSRISNFQVYQKSLEYVVLKWRPVVNAKFYTVSVSTSNDAQMIYTLDEVNRASAGISFRRDYPLQYSDPSNAVANLKNRIPKNYFSSATDFSFFVKAWVLNPITSSLVATQPTEVKIANPMSDKTVADGVTEYWDANIIYNHFINNTTATKYIYYQGQIYKYIIHSCSQVSPTKSNLCRTPNHIDLHQPLIASPPLSDWINMHITDLKEFGFSDSRVADLKNFEWDINQNSVKPVLLESITKSGAPFRPDSEYTTPVKQSNLIVPFSPLFPSTTIPVSPSPKIIIIRKTTTIIIISLCFILTLVTILFCIMLWKINSNRAALLRLKKQKIMLASRITALNNAKGSGRDKKTVEIFQEKSKLRNKNRMF